MLAARDLERGSLGASIAGGAELISTWLQAREDLKYEEVALCTIAFLFAVP